MSITREVEVTIGSEGWELFVSRGIDRLSEVLYTTSGSSAKTHSPDVKTTFSAWHVTGEIKPITIW